jgi:hypothetical protein
MWLRHCFGDLDLCVAHVESNVKFLQASPTVCNFVASIIVTTTDVTHAMYVDPLTRHDHPYFQMFNDLLHNNYDAFHMVWYLEPQT